MQLCRVLDFACGLLSRRGRGPIKIASWWNILKLPHGKASGDRLLLAYKFFHRRYMDDANISAIKQNADGHRGKANAEFDQADGGQKAPVVFGA